MNTTRISTLASVIMLFMGTSYAATNPVCTIDSDGNIPKNSVIDIPVELKNMGSDSGYTPSIEVILPSGMQFIGAMSAGKSKLQPLINTVIIDNDGGDNSFGTVFHPLTNDVLTLPINTTYAVIPFPYHINTPIDEPLKMFIQVQIDDNKPINTALEEDMAVRCGYILGADMYDNPSFDTPIMTSMIYKTITPIDAIPPTNSFTYSVDSDIIAYKPRDTDTLYMPADDIIHLRSGDMITYKLHIQALDSAYLQDNDYTITIQLPYNMMNTSEFTGSSTAVYDANNQHIPPVGTLAYGHNTDVSSTLQPFTAVANPINNTLEIQLPASLQLQKGVDIVFTGTIQDTVMMDTMPISILSKVEKKVNNIVIERRFTDSVMHMSAPKLLMNIGIIGTNATNAQYVPPQTAPVDMNSITNTTAFDDSFTSTELLQTPIKSTIQGVNPNDTIRVAISIINTGTAPAHKIQVKTLLSDLFETATNDDEMNIKVYTADSNNVSSKTSGGIKNRLVMGGTSDATNDIITYNDVLMSMNDDGTDTLIITFDTTIATLGTLLQQIPISAILEHYSASDSGINYTDESDVNGDFEAMTYITSGAVSFDKTLITPLIGDFQHTDITRNDATIGEIVSYELRFSFPDGTLEKPRIVDFMPSGIGFYKPTGVVFKSCGEEEFSGYIPPQYDATLPPYPPQSSYEITSPLGTTGVGASGEPLRVEFADDIIINTDGNNKNNDFCMSYNAVVLDMPANNGLPNRSTLRTNRAIMEFGPFGSRNTGYAGETVNIIEPEMEVVQTVSPLLVEAGERVLFTTTAYHSSRSSADAFDIELTNGILNSANNTPQLSDKLIVDTRFGSDGLDNDGDGYVDSADIDEINGSFYNATTRTFTFNHTTSGTNNTAFKHFRKGEIRHFKYYATIANNVLPGEIIDNNASIQYDSVPNIPLTNIDERMSKAGSGSSLRIRQMEIFKDIIHTTESSTGMSSSRINTPLLTIGEQLTYRIKVRIPNATLTNFTISDTMPKPANISASSRDFMRIISVSEVPTDVVLEDPTITITDRNGDGSNERVDILYSTATRNTTSTDEFIMFDIVAELQNDSRMMSSQLLKNTVAAYHQYNNGRFSAPIVDTADAEITLPELLIDISTADNVLEYGMETVLKVVIDHKNTSQTTAHNLEFTLPIPPHMELITSFGDDNMDNDGDGNVDESDENGSVMWYNYDTQTLHFTQDTTTNTLFTAYNPSDNPLVLQYKTRPRQEVIPSEIIRFTGVLYGSTLSNYNPQHTSERILQVQDTTDVVIKDMKVEKNVVNTSLIETDKNEYDTTQYDVNPGEVITYTIKTVVPQGTIPAYTMTDTLPNGFELLSYRLIEHNGIELINKSVANIDSNNDGVLDGFRVYYEKVINTEIDDNEEYMLFEVVAKPLENGSLIAGTHYRNRVNINFEGNNKPPYEASAGVDVILPSLIIDKSVAPLQAHIGDTITYTVVIKNTSPSPAYDIQLVDMMPTGVITTDTIPSTIDILPPFSTKEITYTAVLQDTLRAGSDVSNTVKAQYFTAPLDGRDKNSVHSYTVEDGILVHIPFDTRVIKDIRTLQTEYRIGEIVPYSIKIAIPQGTHNGINIRDMIPAGLEYIPQTFTIAASNGINIQNTITEWSNTIALGKVVNSNNDASIEEYITITYDVYVLNTADNYDGKTYQPPVDVEFVGVETITNTLPPLVEIVEPLIYVRIGTDYTSGDTATICVRAWNEGRTVHSTAYDIDFWTLILDNIEYSGTLYNGMEYAGNFVIHNAPSDITLDSSSYYPNLKFHLESMSTAYNSNNPVRFCYDVRLKDTVESGTLYNIPAEVLYQSIQNTPTTIPNRDIATERTGDTTHPGGSENDYKSSWLSNLTVVRPDLSPSNKSTNMDTAKRGDTIKYRIEVINKGNTRATKVRLTDILPSYTTDFKWIIEPPKTVVDNSNYSTGGDNNTGYIDLENLVLEPINNAPDNMIAMEYELTVAHNAPAGTMFRNSMKAHKAFEGGAGGDDTTDTPLSEPDLDITKTVLPATTYTAGQTAVYTILVENRGRSSTGTITLTDVIPPEAQYIYGSMMINGSTRTDILDADEADYNATNTAAITILHPPLAANTSFTVQYSVVFSGTMEVKTVINKASVVDSLGYSDDTETPITLLPPTTNGTTTGGSVGTGTTTGTTNGGTGSTTGTTIRRNTPSTPQIKVLKNPIKLTAAKPTKPQIYTDFPVVIEHNPVKNDLVNVIEIPKTGGTLLQDAMNTSVFRDYKPRENGYTELVSLYLQGYITPTDDKNIRPFDAIKRSEMTKIAALMHLPNDGIIPVKAPSGYSDVDAMHYASSYINYVLEEGIMKGYADNTFKPDADMTRGEAYAVLARAFSIAPINGNNHFAEGYYNALREKNIVQMERSIADLDAPIKRYEAFILAYRLNEMASLDMSEYYDTMYITVPKAGINRIPVHRGIVSEASSWRKELSEGAVFYQYKDADDTIKTLLFGHSFRNQNYTKPQFAFTKLITHMITGDTFTLEKDGVETKYEVVQRDIINASEVHLLDSFSVSEADIMLMTCDTLDTNKRHIWEGRVVVEE